jgi:hypothetical protein
MVFRLLNILAGIKTATPEVYIDPNTGGMLFQILAVFLAVFSGILFFFSRQIKSGWARLRRRMRKDEATEETNETPGQTPP